ncbi:unnamed protein product, partial [Mesorhabditis belari]|uniref:Sec1 family domain-containing protein 1 n=1 Tax=Mesorhabditis belari TaxID=2138241 RepID=A0AAF3FGK5_9BILA
MSSMASSQTQAEDNLRYFDPRMMHQPSKESMKLRPHLPADVILFVVGGGNYVEYEKLVEWGRDKGVQRVTYGCTELVSPSQFIEQLSRLGGQL